MYVSINLVIKKENYSIKLEESLLLEGNGGCVVLGFKCLDNF